jgi:guanylate kinase
LDNKIVVLCGKSGVGKDTIARLIEKEGYNFIISTTTRPVRENENEGNPYYFVDRDRFRYLISNNELLEYRKYNTVLNGIPDTWYYGIESKYIKDDEKYIGVLDIDGLKELKRIYGKRVVSFYIYVNTFDRERRVKLRGGFDEKEWNRRFIADERDFDYDKIKIVDYKIENDDLDIALKAILKRLED